MSAPEDPPSFVVRTEAQKAAADNGFRLARGVDAGWLRFGSTTARGDIWIAGAGPAGPWLLSLDRPEVTAELGITPTAGTAGPGVATFAFETLAALYAALDRAYRLGISLPDAPFASFQAAVRDLPRATEAERLVVQRVGQDLFRQALMAYWGGRCPLTGITEPALLRASHIVPWAECATDEHRLDVHNGLLLSALWDAAFDAGPALSKEAAVAIGLRAETTLSGLTAGHRTNLKWHRSRYQFDHTAADR